MAPLDLGTPTHHLRLVDTTGRTVGPASEAYDTLGAYLRAVREHRGLTLNELAAATRIRRLYLAAIEDRDRSALPSRPFAIGYVRAYARALGLDGEGAVQRFKVDWPETDEPLRNPVGVQAETPARNPALTVGLGVLLAAVAGWNIAQRVMSGDGPAPPALPSALGDAPPAAAGVLRVAPPSPAPVESTTPTPYVTPGLFPAEAAEGQPAPATPAAPSPAAGLPAPAGVFSTKAPILGASSGPVVLQARRSVALIVRTADRSIVFARQLQPAEAFRPPLGRALTAEVSDPASVAVYAHNQFKGLLTSLQTPLDALTPAAPAPAPAPVAAAPVPAVAR